MTKLASFGLLASAVALTLSAASRAAIVGPYSVDSNTMHLWHLDEASTPAVDQAHYSYTSVFTPLKDANQPLNVLSGTVAGGKLATLGNAGFAGFGTSLNTSNTTASAQTVTYPANSVQPALCALAPVNGTGDNVDHTFDNPVTHAFTMEAVIQIGFNPALSWQAPQEIIAGEGDAGDSSDRSWQFRIEANPTPGTTPWRLRFQKVSGFGGVGGSTANFNLDGNIPNTGVNAITQSGWYHVAVTYNGNLSDPASLKLFWTAMDASNPIENQLASGNMNGWLREQDCDFALGNEMRDFNGETEPFIGSIDEVRISDIARSALDMQLVPEPSTAAFLAPTIGLLIRRRRA